MKKFIYLILFAFTLLLVKAFYFDSKTAESTSDTNVSIMDENNSLESGKYETAAPAKSKHHPVTEASKMPLDRLGDKIADKIEDKIGNQ